jgi:hypothetical protein
MAGRARPDRISNSLRTGKITGNIWKFRTISTPSPGGLAPIAKPVQRLVANSLFSQKQGMFLVVTGNSVSETGKLQDLAAEKPSGIGFAAHP